MMINEVINDYDKESLQSDKIRLAEFTAERMAMQEKQKMKDKLDHLFLDYLDNEECKGLEFEALELLRRYSQYLKENL